MLRCNSKNPKFKNLTVGKDYEGEIKGDFAEIINDSGAKVRYNKKYFVSLHQRRTFVSLEEILNDIFIEFPEDYFSREEGGQIYIMYSNHNIDINDGVTIEKASNTCGVLLFQGMNIVDQFSQRILNKILESSNLETDVTDSELFDAIMMKLVLEIKDFFKEDTPPFIMLTTNDPLRDSFELFNDRFTAPADRSNGSSSIMTDPAKNPNSANNIAVWIIDVEDFTYDY